MRKEWCLSFRQGIINSNLRLATVGLTEVVLGVVLWVVVVVVVVLGNTGSKVPDTVKPIFHQKLGWRWVPNANEIYTKKHEIYMANASILR